MDKKIIIRSINEYNREAKAQLELKLATSVRIIKNVFINTFIAKDGARKTYILYLTWWGM